MCVIHFHRALPTSSQSALHKKGNSYIESIINVT